MFWRLFYNKDSNDLYIFNIKIVGRQGFDGDLDVDDDDLDVDGPEFDQKFEEGYNFQKEYESLEEEGFHLADWGTIVMCTAIEKGISIDC